MSGDISTVMDSWWVFSSVDMGRLYRRGVALVEPSPCSAALVARKAEHGLGSQKGRVSGPCSYFSFASARRAAARSVFSQEKAVALTVSPSPLR